MVDFFIIFPKPLSSVNPSPDIDGNNKGSGWGPPTLAVAPVAVAIAAAVTTAVSGAAAVVAGVAYT